MKEIRWISVSEGLPPINIESSIFIDDRNWLHQSEDVLVYDKDSDIIAVAYTYENVDHGESDGLEWYMTWGDGKLEEVTHWAKVEKP